MKMNQKIKKLWVAALRSGKYKQTTGGLKSIDGFCCLGVLCDLHRKKMKKKGWIETQWLRFFKYKGSNGTLPNDVMKWAGLHIHNPNVKNESLSNWNDVSKKNFSWIADVIETEL